MKNKKRTLEFNQNNKYFQYIARPLFPYFEDYNIEDLQINEFNKITLIKRDGSREFVIDNEINEYFVKNFMFYIASLSGANFSYGDTQITHMLPINRFRFTGRVDKTINSGVKISIRLNDGVLHHTYKDFNLSNLEFNFLVNHICNNKSSCFFIGETGSGKTTFNNILINKISDNEIINVVGDINEIIFRKEQHVSEITAKTKEDYQTSFDLLTRSNPDRIIVPELTTNNGNLILRAMNSGTKGFMITLHASSKDNSVAEAFSDNLKLSKEDSVPVSELDKKIKTYIDFLIHLGKNTKGNRAIEKLVINNKDIENEAKQLGIFGFTKEYKKHKTPIKKQNNISNKIILKLINDHINKNLSLRQLEKIYNIKYYTIHRILKKVFIEK